MVRHTRCGHRGHTLVHRPLQCNLSRGCIVLRGQSHQAGIPEAHTRDVVRLRRPGEGSPSLHRDPQSAHLLEECIVVVAQVPLHLIHHRPVACADQFHGLLCVVVADADRADLAGALQILEAAPSVEALLLELRAALVREVSHGGAREVDDQQVEVVDADLRQVLVDDLVDRRVVPDRALNLRRQEELLARHAGSFDASAGVRLRLVEQRHVDVAPAKANPLLHSALHGAALVRHRHRAEGQHRHRHTKADVRVRDARATRDDDGA
mmetsp:Transcript_89603/g.256719  ORF Transcript_89603/g.256719 Transcript_89603/m.256719 type:complete len:266 (+) Transcript_89603:415-1212(+)